MIFPLHLLAIPAMVEYELADSASKCRIFHKGAVFCKPLMYNWFSFIRH